VGDHVEVADVQDLDANLERSNHAGLGGSDFLAIFFAFLESLSAFRPSLMMSSQRKDRDVHA
jgi:hypothetical protein